MGAPARLLLSALGLTFVGLAALGVFLPLLPTTPFLLLAAACFARSSPKLHSWLVASPLFGPLLLDWERHGAISPKAKWTCTVVLLGTIAWPVGTGKVTGWLLLALAVTVCGVLSFIWSRPSGPRPGSVADAGLGSRDPGMPPGNAPAASNAHPEDPHASVQDPTRPEPDSTQGT